MDTTEEEPFDEPSPPSPDTVARRALVLAVVSCRGITDEDPAAAALAKSSLDWLRDLDLEDELTDWDGSCSFLRSGL